MMRPAERLLTIAQGDMGLKEIKGRAHNPRIIEMFQQVGHPEINNDETAWCAAAVGAWLIEAGFPVPPRASNLMAMSYEQYGVKADEFTPGAICVFYRTAKRERDWRRHVGIAVSQTDKSIKVIGGNQSNSVSVRTFRKSDLVAMRLPVEMTVKALKAAGSQDMKIAGIIKQVAGAGAATASAGAVVGKTNTPPVKAEIALPALDLKSMTDEMSTWQMFIEGAKALGDLVFAQPWLVIALAGGAGFYLLARLLEKQRIKRALAGHPLSSETEGNSTCLAFQ